MPSLPYTEYISFHYELQIDWLVVRHLPAVALYCIVLYCIPGAEPKSLIKNTGYGISSATSYKLQASTTNQVLLSSLCVLYILVSMAFVMV